MFDRIDTKCPHCGSIQMAELYLTGNKSMDAVQFFALCLNCNSDHYTYVPVELLHLIVQRISQRFPERFKGCQPWSWPLLGERSTQSERLRVISAAEEIFPAPYELESLKSHPISLMEWCENVRKFAELPEICALYELTLGTSGDTLDIYVYYLHYLNISGTRLNVSRLVTH
jgi:hypothetical protein